MFRFVPPAGVPLDVSELLRVQKAVILSNGYSENSPKAVASRLGVRYSFATSSGRAALWLIFRALKRLRPDRSVVAVPAYTCFTVPAAVIRAGLKVCPIDMDLEALDFDFDELEAVSAGDLLCIVSSNLFGFPNNLARLVEIGRAKGTFVIDDAAQSLGASRAGALSGTCADAGVFSFGRGKPVPAMEGGLAVTNSEFIAEAIQTEAGQLSRSSLVHSAQLLFETFAYSLFLNPGLYWIPNSLPFLKLGTTEFDPDFPLTSMSPLSNALLPIMMAKLPGLLRVRAANAASIAAALAGNSSFSIPRPSSDSAPGYLRFPVLAGDEETRNRVVAALQAAGIGASAFYPTAICDIPGLEYHRDGCFHHCPRAESLASRIFTLPTHPLVSKDDLARMLNVLAGFGGMTNS